MTTAVQQAVVALAALGATAVVVRRVVLAVRPPQSATPPACEGCAVADLAKASLTEVPSTGNRESP